MSSGMLFVAFSFWIASPFAVVSELDETSDLCSVEICFQHCLSFMFVPSKFKRLIPLFCIAELLTHRQQIPPKRLDFINSAAHWEVNVGHFRAKPQSQFVDLAYARFQQRNDECNPPINQADTTARTSRISHESSREAQKWVCYWLCLDQVRSALWFNVK